MVKHDKEPLCKRPCLDSHETAICLETLNGTLTLSSHHLQGFRTIKVLRGRTTTAFVAFDTTEQAISAHGAHQVRADLCISFKG